MVEHELYPKDFLNLRDRDWPAADEGVLEEINKVIANKDSERPENNDDPWEGVSL